MPHDKREKTRIALLIVVAVLAITVAMLEALVDNAPSPATAAPLRRAPSALSPAVNPDEPTYSQVSAQRASE